MNDDIDEMDRALFALPLEEPPAGMRSAILRATIGASARASLARTLPFATWEIVSVGSALAVVVWLVLALVADRALATAITSSAVVAVQAFVQPTTLLWLIAGGAVVAWFSVGSALVESRFVRSRS